MKASEKQYNMRLNLDNPFHLEVYKKLSDLNMDIHKSINQFMIESVYKNIKSYEEEDLTHEAAVNMPKKYATKEELKEMEHRLQVMMLQSIAQVLSTELEKRNNVTLSSGKNTDSVQDGDSDGEEIPADDTLSELAMSWTD